MSTYTDLHTRIRENLTILRCPGSPEDGLTPQRVIFANPENIYEGTFKGTVKSISASFASCDFTDCTINGGKIIDATIYSDGQEIPVAELTTNVSELQEELSSTIENVNIALSSCNTISIDLTSLSTSVSTLSSSLEQNSISTLAALSSCKELDKRIDDLISGDSGIQKISAEVISVLSTAVDGNLSSISSSLCSTVDSKLASLESSLASQIEKVSSDFNGFVESDFADACISIGSEASIRHANEQYLSGEISSNTEQILQIKDCIKGGLVYSGTLSVDEHTTTLWKLIRTKDEDMPLSTMLKAGFFYVISASSKVSSYNVEGVELEHGDWMLINEDIQLGNVTSAQIDVLDAQDYDNFKLGDDNTATGDNIFTGNNVFNGSNTFNGNQSFDNGNVSFGSSCTAEFNNTGVFKDGITVDGTTIMSGDAKFYGNADFYQNVQMNSAEIESLSLQLSAVSYAADNGRTSSLADLTSSIDGKFDSASLSIAGLSSELSNATRYFGTLSNGYDDQPTTLSAFLDKNITTLSAHSNVLQKGYLYRISNDINIRVSNDSIELLHANDFIVLNKQTTLGSIVWQDIDIIRNVDVDAWMALVNGLSNSISTLDVSLGNFVEDISKVSSSLTTDIEYLSNAISNIIIPSDLSDFTNSPGYLTKTSADIDFQPKGEYLVSNDVKLSYSDQTIWLSSKSYVTSVDCTDFIKDGMLSAVELCSEQLVFNFNADAKTNPISIVLSNFIDKTQYWKKDQTSSNIQLSSEFGKYLLSGNYLSSNALDGYKTYAETLTSLSSDGYATLAQLNNCSIEINNNVDYISSQTSSIIDRFQNISINASISSFIDQIENYGINSVKVVAVVSALYSLVKVLGYSNNKLVTP